MDIVIEDSLYLLLPHPVTELHKDLREVKECYLPTI